MEEIFIDQSEKVTVSRWMHPECGKRFFVKEERAIADRLINGAKIYQLLENNPVKSDAQNADWASLFNLPALLLGFGRGRLKFERTSLDSRNIAGA